MANCELIVLNYLMVALQIVVSPTSPSASQDGAAARADAPSDIVVIGRRGDAAAPIEKEFASEEIQRRRLNTIGDVLTDLATDIDPTGKLPVLLINGKEIGDDKSILSFPPEALSRITVLKGAAGPKFGAFGGARVVNLVLKPHFAMFITEAGITSPTAGGQSGETVSASRDVISGDTRWSTRLSYGRQGALRRSDRPGSGAAVDSGLPSPETIDQVAGQWPVPGPSDRRYETLLPASDNFAFGINLSKPIGGLAMSIGLDAGINRTTAVGDIPSARTVEFADTVDDQCAWIFANRPQQISSLTKNLSASTTTTGNILGFGSSISESLGIGQTISSTDAGIDLASFDATNKSPGAGVGFSLNRHAPLLTIISYTRTLNFSVHGQFRKVAFMLPAGEAQLSVNSSLATGSVETQGGIQNGSTFDRNGFRTASISATLNLPVFSGVSHFGPVGDLSFAISAGRGFYNGGASGSSYSTAVIWSPIDNYQLQGAFDFAFTPPSFDQLFGPRVASVKSVYDYKSEASINVNYVTGGNPYLAPSTQRSFSFDLVGKPLPAQNISVRIGYRADAFSNQIVNFPQLTPAIEKAFPDRVIRDSAGNLSTIDARPVSLGSSRNSSANIVLNFRRALNSKISGVSFDRTTIELNVKYQIKIESVFDITGGPSIDRLTQTGQSRNQLDLRANIGTSAFSANFAAGWQSRAAVTQGDNVLHIRQPLLVDVGISLDADRLIPRSTSTGWARRMRVSLGVTNLLDDFARVASRDGSLTPGYNRADVDPLGRTVSLSLRKQF